MKSEQTIKQFKIKPENRQQAKILKETLKLQSQFKLSNDKGVPYTEFTKSIKGDVSQFKKTYLKDLTSSGKPGSSQKKKELHNKMIDVNEFNNYFSNQNNSQRQEYL